MKMMKDYHDLYLECDVLLLADVFEKFRNNSIKNYGYVQVITWVHQSEVEMQCYLFQILICTYSLKKIRDVEFLIFLTNIVKPIINI